MTARTKSTLKMICIRSGITNEQIPKEAQKILKLYNDPGVAPEQKQIVKAEIDETIRKLEERVTTRRLKEEKNGDLPMGNH